MVGIFINVPEIFRKQGYVAILGILFFWVRVHHCIIKNNDRFQPAGIQQLKRINYDNQPGATGFSFYHPL